VSVRKFSVTLETVTPLFLGGSEPRGEPELRAPSFRGVMRFWLRALLGGVLGNDPEEIFQHESAVFGSTDHSSPVVVRVSGQGLDYVGCSELTADKPGLGYLFFSARLTRPERKAIPAGKTFELSCGLRAGAQDEKALKAAFASLWLLTHLGGIGSRSRRGGGNLQVSSVEVEGDVPSSTPSLQVAASCPKTLQSELAQGLKQLRQWAAQAFNGSPQPKFDGQPNFDVLHPDFCEIWVVDRAFKSWDEALDKFGSAIQQFRKRYEPDYSNVKAVVQGRGTLRPVMRSAFGLPIVFFFNSLYRQYRNQLLGEGFNEQEASRRAREKASAELVSEEHDRRASPLIVRVVKLADGNCALVLIRFIAMLLPEGEGLKLRQRGGTPQEAQKPDDGEIEAVWQQFTDKLQEALECGLLEVTGW